MSDNRIIECMERAQYLLGNLMAVKPGEEVLIVVDPQTDERMTQAMAAAALNCGAEYGVYMMPIRGKDKATIFPKSLELGMDACDVFVGMTTASGAAIYNNHLKELINQKKVREVSICLRSIDNFTRGGALADYEAVYADGEKLQAIWRGHKMARKWKVGTDYSGLGKVQYILAEAELPILDSEYGEGVDLTILVPFDQAGAAEKKLIEGTNGRCQIENLLPPMDPCS